MDSYKQLKAWSVGLELLKEVYKISKLFPQQEQFGMTFQIRKAAASILANIAEGYGRYTYPDKANKYIIARGECAEVEAFLEMSIAVGLVPKIRCKSALELVSEEKKIISGLIKACRKHEVQQT